MQQHWNHVQLATGFTTFGTRAVDPRTRNNGFDVDEDWRRECLLKMKEAFDIWHENSMARINKIFEDAKISFASEGESKEGKRSEETTMEEEVTKISEEEVFDEMSEITMEEIEADFIVEEQPIRHDVLGAADHRLNLVLSIHQNQAGMVEHVEYDSCSVGDISCLISRKATEMGVHKDLSLSPMNAMSIWGFDPGIRTREENSELLHNGELHDVTKIAVKREKFDAMGTGGHRNEVPSEDFHGNDDVPNSKPIVTAPFLHEKCLLENVVLSCRDSHLSADYDLSKILENEVPKRGKTLVPTDINIVVPEGTYAHIVPQSRLTLKRLIDVGASVVDTDCRMSVKVIIFNTFLSKYERDGFRHIHPIGAGTAAVASTTGIIAGSVVGSVAVARRNGDVAGAGLAGRKMTRRNRDVDFEFKDVGQNHNQGRLVIHISESRFVFEEDDFIRSWEGLSEYFESYILHLESKHIIVVSTAIQEFIAADNTMLVSMSNPQASFKINSLFEDNVSVSFGTMLFNGLMLSESDSVLEISCSHYGYVTEGHYYFRGIFETWGVQHKIEHFRCMVDLLNRVGLLDEALELVKCPIAILGAEKDNLAPPELLEELGEILTAKSEVDSFVKIFDVDPWGQGSSKRGQLLWT